MSRILWVDDDYQVIRGLIRPLERAGYTFDNVGSIAAALKKLHSDTLYDLAIIDILLPLDETILASMPAEIKAAGTNAGEGLIAYMRYELGLKIPIIVMSILGGDRDLMARLEPYEVSQFLHKGSLSPFQVKEAVERAFDEVDQERAIVLNLRSKKREERQIGLLHASQMEPTPKLHRTLLWLARTEQAPDLRQQATDILKDYPITIHPDADPALTPETDLFPVEHHLSLKRQLVQRSRNLDTLREQEALYGAGAAPLQLLNQIKAEEDKIKEILAELQALDDGT
jgi:CheY-like chemotaxis protein